MDRKIAAGALGLVTLAVVGWIAADYLVETDEERIEAFADIVTSRLDSETIDKGLTYANPSMVALTVQVRGNTAHFDRDSAPDFQSFARRGLTPFAGERLSPIQRKIEVEGTTGHLTVYGISRRGQMTADFEMQKIGDQWLVREVRLQ